MSTAASPLATSLEFETSLANYPGLNRFALDFTRRVPSTLAFLPSMDVSSITASRQTRDASLREGLIRTNREWGNDVGDAVGRWSRGETATLIAGQQVGFGGGPLYTLAKILSLLRLRDDLGVRGIPATVFFWLATEDHDFAEVAQLTLATREGLCHLRAAEHPSRPRPVGTLPVPDSLRRELLAKIGSPPPSWLEPGITFRDSFARLLVAILGSGTVVLVDALLPELRRAGVGLLREIHERRAELDEVLRSRSRQIEEAGYKPQVEPGSDGEYSLLYSLRDGERRPIRGGEKLDQPELISTGVLARPLLQDAVLQPDIFVGGPAEVAYYAQVTALHERLSVRPPAVALRGHAWVAPAKLLRFIDQYELSVEDLFLSVDEAIARHETTGVAELQALIARTDASVAEQLEELSSFISRYDPTMDRSLNRAMKSIRYQLQKVAQRGRRAIARYDADRYNAVTRLHNALLPGDEPQDRVIGWISYWLQYGRHFLDRLTPAVQPATDRLKIIGL